MEHHIRFGRVTLGKLTRKIKADDGTTKAEISLLQQMDTVPHILISWKLVLRLNFCPIRLVYL